MNSKVYNRDVWLLLAATFFYASSSFSIVPLIAGFSESLGASTSFAGVIGGMMSLCSLLFRPISGALADKISKFRLCFSGALVMCAGCVCCALAPRPAFLAAGRLITGLGYALCSVCISIWLSGILPRDKVGSGMGLYGIAGALANATAPGLSVILWERFGYRVSLASAAFYAAALALMAWLVHDKGEPSPEARARKFQIQLVEPRVLPVAAIAMFSAIYYYASQSFLVSYVAARQLNVSVELYLTGYAVALMVLRFFLKDLFDKLPFRFLITGSLLSSAVGMGLLTVMTNNAVLLLAAVFMAGGYGLSCSICQSTTILLAGEGRRGVASSTYFIGIDLGMMIGPIIGGLVFDHLPPALFYPILAITAPISLSICWFNRICREGAAGADKKA